MTKEQEICKSMIKGYFIYQRKSMTSTLVYMNRHGRNIANRRGLEFRAWRSLTENERNEVLYEILREELEHVGD